MPIGFNMVPSECLWTSRWTHLAAAFWFSQSVFTFMPLLAALTASIHLLHLLHTCFSGSRLSTVTFPHITACSPASLLSLKLSQFLLTALNVSHDSFWHSPLKSRAPLFLTDRCWRLSTPGNFPSLSCWLFRVFAEAVHHVSVSINISHSSLVCGEAWGTDPHFSWLYERVAVDNRVGRVSNDGTTLYVTKIPFCGHFTCTVSNKLGYSSATYTAGTGKDQFVKTFIAGLQIDWKILNYSCFNIEANQIKSNDGQNN